MEAGSVRTGPPSYPGWMSASMTETAPHPTAEDDLDPALSREVVPTAAGPTAAHVEEPPPAKPEGTSHWSDPFAFLFTVLLQSCIATLEALGFRHPLRIPAVLLIWGVTTAFLGLPIWVLSDLTWENVIKYGNWRHAAWLAAVIEVSALFIFHVLFSGPRVAMARHRVPALGVATLISRGESLYWMRISSDIALKGWMERVRNWTALCERELTETLSSQDADAFRRPTVIQVYKHQQRYNEVHNGWLDLLAKRLDVLRSISGRFKPKKRFVEEKDSKA
jgi:hypothetical protein